MIIKLDDVKQVLELSNTLTLELQKTQDYVKNFVRQLDGVQDPLYRNLLYQMYVEGLTIEQIAERMSYSERHICRLLSKAREEFYGTDKG